MSRNVAAEIELLEADIERLRKQGTAEANRYANDLEVRLVMVRQKMERIENLTIERLAAWVKEVITEIENKGIPKGDLSSWPERLRSEIFEALQVAWGAARFRAREAAAMMGVSHGTVLEWLHAQSWKTWLAERPRREDQAATIIDMSMQRASSILALDTNEPEILKIQSSLIKTVLSSAPGVPGQVPKKRGPTRPIQGLPSHSATEAESVPAPEKRKRSVERRK